MKPKRAMRPIEVGDTVQIKSTIIFSDEQWSLINMFQRERLGLKVHSYATHPNTKRLSSKKLIRRVPGQGRHKDQHYEYEFTSRGREITRKMIVLLELSGVHNDLVMDAPTRKEPNDVNIQD